ncbi:MAG: OsmC family protein [Asgard group archaeon]|nr:OsmC family protein [Asgard group archaeon]
MIVRRLTYTKSTYRLVKNYQAVVDNGRNHATIIDLAPTSEGEDTGPTALELCVMSYSGCIGTIFAKIARKMRLNIERLEVDMDADKGDDDPTISKIKATVYIKSPDPIEKLEKCLDLTMTTCPVGVLFDRAHIAKEVIIKKID